VGDPGRRITLDGVEQVREKLAPGSPPPRNGARTSAQVTFENLKDPAERLYFKQVKKRLQLPKEQIDKVREDCGPPSARGARLSEAARDLKFQARLPQGGGSPLWRSAAHFEATAHANAGFTRCTSCSLVTRSNAVREETKGELLLPAPLAGLPIPPGNVCGER